MATKAYINRGTEISADNVYHPHIYDEGGISDTISGHIAEIITEKEADINEEKVKNYTRETITQETTGQWIYDIPDGTTDLIVFYHLPNTTIPINSHITADVYNPISGTSENKAVCTTPYSSSYTYLSHRVHFNDGVVTSTYGRGNTATIGAETNCTLAEYLIAPYFKNGKITITPLPAGTEIVIYYK